MVMNEYRLNPLDPNAQKIMEEQLEQFFFGEGAKLPEGYVAPRAKGYRSFFRCMRQGRLCLRPLSTGGFSLRFVTSCSSAGARQRMLHRQLRPNHKLQSSVRLAQRRLRVLRLARARKNKSQITRSLRPRRHAILHAAP